MAVDCLPVMVTSVVSKVSSNSHGVPVVDQVLSTIRDVGCCQGMLAITSLLGLSCLGCS